MEPLRPENIRPYNRSALTMDTLRSFIDEMSGNGFKMPIEWLTQPVDKEAEAIEIKLEASSWVEQSPF